MNTLSRSPWLALLETRGLDVDALVAGEALTLADFERHVARWADLAVAEAQAAAVRGSDPEAEPGSRAVASGEPWAGTQAARLAALAKEAA